MTIDRQQIRRDAEKCLADQPNRLSTWTGNIYAQEFARHCLALLTELEETERAYEIAKESITPVAYYGDAQEKIDQLEARLANVPALIEAAKDAVSCIENYPLWRGGLGNMRRTAEQLREALAAYETSGDTTNPGERSR